MSNIGKAPAGIFIMLAGWVLMLLLTALFGRYFSMIGILGIFVALGGYVWAYHNATCNSCEKPVIDGASGLSVMTNIALGKSFKCPSCGADSDTTDPQS